MNRLAELSNRRGNDSLTDAGVGGVPSDGGAPARRIAMTAAEPITLDVINPRSPHVSISHGEASGPTPRSAMVTAPPNVRPLHMTRLRVRNERTGSLLLCTMIMPPIAVSDMALAARMPKGTPAAPVTSSTPPSTPNGTPAEKSQALALLRTGSTLAVSF